MVRLTSTLRYPPSRGWWATPTLAQSMATRGRQVGVGGGGRLEEGGKEEEGGKDAGAVLAFGRPVGLVVGRGGDGA